MSGSLFYLLKISSVLANKTGQGINNSLACFMIVILKKENLIAGGGLFSAVIKLFLLTQINTLSLAMGVYNMSTNFGRKMATKVKQKQALRSRL